MWEKPHLFLGLFDAGSYLSVGCNSFILGRLDVLLVEYGEAGFDTQLLDPNLAS